MDGLRDIDTSFFDRYLLVFFEEWELSGHHAIFRCLPFLEKRLQEEWPLVVLNSLLDLSTYWAMLGD
jgi:hypothetical protein